MTLFELIKAGNGWLQVRSHPRRSTLSRAPDRPISRGGQDTGHDDGLVHYWSTGGSACVEVMELAQHRQLDPARVENLLMRQKAVALPYEDAITYGVNAGQVAAGCPGRRGPRSRRISSSGSCLD